MASPPSHTPATSPPAPSTLALPRPRPGLILPTTAISSRKASATSTASAHPLRQTSFPPSESLEAQHAGAVAFSPEGDEEFSDGEIGSAINALGDDGSRKRKRGEKRGKGRPRKEARAGSASLVNGEGGSSTAGGRGYTAGAASTAGADADAEAPDDDEDEDVAAIATSGFTLSAADVAHESRRHAEFRSRIPQWQQERYDSWKRAKLRTADVRRLVNATLSQSCPANVVAVVQGYAKLFAGLIVEGARQVQGEWVASQLAGADGDAGDGRRPSSFSTSRHRANGYPAGDDTAGSPQPKPNGTAPSPKSPHSAPQHINVEECDRGPLLPDHLREALRRYKQARYGGVPVGFTGLSLEGRENAAARMGGKRLFK